MSNLVELDAYKSERIERELGPARFLTLSELHADLDLALDEVEREDAAIRRAIASVLSQPDEPDFDLVDEDDLPAPPLHVEPAREPSTLPPCAPVDGTFAVAAVLPWRIR